MYLQALAITQEALGERHPETVSCLNNLALLYQSQGRYGEAELLFKRVLTILIKVLGMQHQNTQIASSNYSMLLKKMENKKIDKGTFPKIQKSLQ